MGETEAGFNTKALMADICARCYLSELENDVCKHFTVCEYAAVEGWLHGASAALFGGANDR